MATQPMQEPRTEFQEPKSKRECLVPGTWELGLPSAAVDQLQAHLQSRLLGKVRGLQVLLKDQGVILRGHSRTYYAKQLAQHAVMEAADFPTVVNEIEVF